MDLTAQMLMVGFRGLKLGDELKRLIIDEGVGGVIFFSRNIESPSQVSDLTDRLCRLAAQRNPDIPLLIAIDQEGGRVSRLAPPFRQYPSCRELAKHGSDDVVRENMLKMAEELSDIGINMNMAPVLDVDTNPDNPVIGDRSFSADPYLVGRFAGITIEAFKQKGIIAVGKHFPGHGDTFIDSHLDLPVVNKNMTQLEKTELIPFRMAFENGLSAMMTAHIIFPKIDPDCPATISKLILSGLLRRNIGFDGVVISDDIEMKGISRGRSIGEIVSNGIEAGIDIFLCCHTLKYQKEILIKIRELMKQGINWEKKICDSIKRITHLKKFHLYPKPEITNYKHQITNRSQYSTLK